ESQRRETHTLISVELPPALRVLGPLVECGRVVRVVGIHPGARLEIYMTCASPPGIRKIAALQVHAKVADIPLVPALPSGTKSFCARDLLRWHDRDVTDRYRPNGRAVRTYDRGLR